MPAESGRLARQVAQLNDALLKSETHIVAAETLQEADAIVRVTGYRHTIDSNGVPSGWWDIQVKLLTPVARDAKHVQPLPPQLRLLVVGRQQWEMEPALDLLSEVLARALGRRRAASRDTI